MNASLTEPASGYPPDFPPDWREQLKRLPKAELHLHLEGSIAQEDLRALALRHGDAATARRAQSCYTYQDFSGFLQAFKTVSRLLATPEDYAFILRRLAESLRAQGVVYAELILSVGVAHWKGMDWPTIWQALENERRRITGEYGLRLAWIFDAVRQFGFEPAGRVLAEALTCRQHGPVVAFGIGGDEAAIEARVFAPLYNEAAKAGLHRTIHAGESRGPESVWEAIQELKPERIGHGIGSVQDDALMDKLAHQNIWLEVCPSSNLRTGVVPSLAGHPIRRLWEKRVPLTLASDDPAMFETTLLHELALLPGLGFSWNDLLRLLDNSFAASFLPEVEKERFRLRLAQALKSPGAAVKTL